MLERSPLSAVNLGDGIKLCDKLKLKCLRGSDMAVESLVICL